LQSGMTIGRLAEAAGINVETIRYYQRRGLLDEPRKPLGGHRRYPPDAVRTLAFIRRAQQLGFSLEEVKSLLALARGSNAKATRALAEAKYELLGTRVAQLNKMRKQLERLIAASKRARDGADPMIDALFSENDLD